VGNIVYSTRAFLFTLVLLGICVMGHASDTVTLYNGTGKLLYVTSIVYTKNQHKDLHIDQEVYIKVRGRRAPVEVYTVASGSFVKLERPLRKLGFSVDRDIWFSDMPRSLANALESRTRSGLANDVQWVNVGSSVKEIFVATVSGIPSAYTSRALFDANSRLRWEDISLKSPRNTVIPAEGFMERYSAVPARKPAGAQGGQAVHGMGTATSTMPTALKNPVIPSSNNRPPQLVQSEKESDMSRAGRSKAALEAHKKRMEKVASQQYAIEEE